MAASSHCSLSLYYPPQVIADAITCSPQRGHGHCRSAPMSMPIFIVSSPVEIASRFPLPPEGAWALPLRANVHANFHCLIPRGNRFAFSTAPKGGSGIAAPLLRSIFSFNLRLRAGLRPLPTAVRISRDSLH